MRAFGVDFFGDTCEAGVFDCAVTTVDCTTLYQLLYTAYRWAWEVLTVEEGVVEEVYATET